MTQDNHKIQPIFIFSLPRTGSTLLQRILMGHDTISSFAEPHFILPFVYANKKEGTISSYSHISSYKAVSDVVKSLPNKEDDYFRFLNTFSLELYQALAKKGSTYFLDKTPVYVWIIPEIVKIFPKAKFIFLFRNPIHNYASILSTFSKNGYKKFYRFKRYMDEGIEVLSENYDILRDRSVAVKYENLINSPLDEVQKLCTYLEIDYQEDMLNMFSKQDLIGRSMDPSGVRNYNSISTDPLQKWKRVFNSPFRKKILSRFLQKLSTRSLKTQGYNKGELLNSVNAFRPKWDHSLIKDFYYYHRNNLIIRFNLNAVFAGNLKWSRNYYLN